MASARLLEPDYRSAVKLKRAAHGARFAASTNQGVSVHWMYVFGMRLVSGSDTVWVNVRSG